MPNDVGSKELVMFQIWAQYLKNCKSDIEKTLSSCISKMICDVLNWSNIHSLKFLQVLNKHSVYEVKFLFETKSLKNHTLFLYTQGFYSQI